ncbi:lysis protein [Lonsdalea quercina]|uniref:lysis protein n=1 Tax=Lonsdalea quercina TaxID=71657 RepID=UPI00397578E3
MSRVIAAGVALTFIILGILSMLSIHLYEEYQDEKSRAERAEQLADAKQKTLDTLQAKQREVAAIDQKYTQELADAKQTIADLQRDVDSGAKRLRVNATCRRVSGATTTASVVNESGAQLTRTSQRDYFTLRERIATAEKQIAGLQGYIKTITSSSNGEIR